MNAVITVHGQGPVGLAFALFALRAGVPCEALRFATPLADPALLPANVAHRALALSLGSWQLLGRVISPPAAGLIREVEVSLANRSGRTQIFASDIAAEALGYVVDYRSLLAALQKAIHRSLADESIGSGASSGAGVHIDVHAEGQPGDEQSANVDIKNFNQHALLTTLKLPLRKPARAFERFSPQGPIALLPLANPQHFSLVWCTLPDNSERLVQLGEPEFLNELQTQLDADLGDATLLGPRVSTPVQRRRRRQLVHDNEVWIGNAAQTLHPVAGQGLNLGLRDAFELAQSIGGVSRSSHNPGLAAPDPGQYTRALANFARERRTDRTRTILITDTLASMFSLPWAAAVQSLALSSLDLTPAARNRFARQMMFGSR